MSERNVTNNLFLILMGSAALAIMQPSILMAGKANKQEQAKVGEKTGRDALRAFYTAPPVIPHEVAVRNSSECLYCHKEVADIGGRTTVKTPHPEFSNCMQCHVQGAVNEVIDVQNSWQGLEEPAGGMRAHEFAPPLIPHRITLRENCLSCHGPDNPDEKLRTTHPERSNCQQCHVAAEDVEFEIKP